MVADCESRSEEEACCEREGMYLFLFDCFTADRLALESDISRSKVKGVQDEDCKVVCASVEHDHRG